MKNSLKILLVLGLASVSIASDRMSELLKQKLRLVGKDLEADSLDSPDPDFTKNFD